MSAETPWLETLEAKVEAAVAEIERLRSENEGLRESLAERGSREPEGVDESQASWREERDRVRSRVEGIVERLEGLLGE